MHKIEKVFKNVIKFFSCGVPSDERSKELLEKLFADSKSENDNVKFNAMIKLMKLARDMIEEMSNDMLFGEIVRVNMKKMIKDINDILSNEFKDMENKDSFYFN